MVDSNKSMTGEKSILIILKKSDRPISLEEIVNQTEMKESKVRTTLGKMVKEKTVRRAGRDNFTAASSKRRKSKKS